MPVWWSPPPDARIKRVAQAIAEIVHTQHGERDRDAGQVDAFGELLHPLHRVGQLDPEQLFYLQSRGLDPAEARLMLCLGFAVEVIDVLSDSVLREHALGLLKRRLGGPEEGAA